jgi:hypothetical protein
MNKIDENRPVNDSNLIYVYKNTGFVTAVQVANFHWFVPLLAFFLTLAKVVSKMQLIVKIVSIMYQK